MAATARWQLRLQSAELIVQSCKLFHATGGASGGVCLHWAHARTLPPTPHDITGWLHTFSCQNAANERRAHARCLPRSSIRVGDVFFTNSSVFGTVTLCVWVGCGVCVRARERERVCVCARLCVRERRRRRRKKK